MKTTAQHIHGGDISVKVDKEGRATLNTLCLSWAVLFTADKQLMEHAIQINGLPPSVMVPLAASILHLVAARPALMREARANISPENKEDLELVEHIQRTNKESLTY